MVHQGLFYDNSPFHQLVEERKRLDMESNIPQAFDALKKTITEEPILSLSDLNKPFELQTDASNFAIGGVLT